jgi:hypothetical protein
LFLGSEILECGHQFAGDEVVGILTKTDGRAVSENLYDHIVVDFLEAVDKSRFTRALVGVFAMEKA